MKIRNTINGRNIQLLATDRTKAGIIKKIAKCFGCKPERYRLGSWGSIWYKLQNGKEEDWLRNFRVVRQRGYYRFESVF